MSKFHAEQALTRMNMRDVFIAPHDTSMVTALSSMFMANAEQEETARLARRGELCAAFGMTERTQEKEFAFSNGFAIIPVTGLLLNRFGGSYGGVTGYSFIRRQFNAALADKDVKGIIFDVNSNGGEAAGCFELCDEIFAARDKKPSLSVVDSNAYSAGYAIASAAGKMVTIPSAGVGSIGVVAMHADLSGALDKFGVKINFIQFGKHKTDGSPFAALSDDARKNIQASVDKSGEIFVAQVARNRNIDAKVVRDTQAQTYRAEDAQALGLIDAIATPSVAAQAFLDELSGSESQLRKEETMSGQDTQAGGSNTTQALAAAAPTAAQLETARQEAVTAERARAKSIMGCDEAKDKQKLAQHCVDSGLSLEVAKGVLSAAAPEKPAAAAPAPAAAGNAFKAHMDAGDHPNVGAGGSGGEGGGGADEDMATAQQVLALQNKHGSGNLKRVK